MTADWGVALVTLAVAGSLKMSFVDLLEYASEVSSWCGTVLYSLHDSITFWSFVYPGLAAAGFLMTRADKRAPRFTRTGTLLVFCLCAFSYAVVHGYSW